MIPLAVPNLCGREAEYLQECIDSTFVSSVGPFVDRLEQMVAEQSGASHGVATSSGTTGLHLALTAVGVGRDDLVILPSFTFIASANAIAHCGAAPWLLDVDPDSWTLDADCLRQALEEETVRQGDEVVHRASGRRVAAIMPVYTLGVVANMDLVALVAKEFGLPVVADAACAMGAEYKQEPVGGLADLTVFSFNGNKTFTAGGGGAVVGCSDALVGLCKHLSTTARKGRDYDHDRIGFNYRMPNINAAVGCAQLEQAKEFIAAKRRIAKRYTEDLAVLAGLKAFPAPDWSRSTCWFSGVVVEGGEWPSVAETCKKLQQEGIQARIFWKPIHFQMPYKHAPVSWVGVSEGIWSQILTLPCSTQLTDSEQDQVIETMKRLRR